mmetsp:Transcript_59001/g.125094  ORF Transcript_59001/g.125094 Transcript_59001/m.125094 type:complete len:153 (-) Transcript_59001:241-699(-)
MAVESEASTVAQRREEAAKLLKKHPTRVPVICHPAPRSKLPELSRTKFLVAGTMVCSEFKHVVEKHLQEVHFDHDANQTLYLFVQNHTALKSTTKLSECYESYKSDDSFLYLVYGTENTLGGNLEEAHEHEATIVKASDPVDCPKASEDDRH